MRIPTFSFINQERQKHQKKNSVNSLLGRRLSNHDWAMHRLYEENETAQLILRLIDDAVVTTDVKGRVQFLNPAAEKMTGWKHKEAIGLPFGQVVNLFDDETHEPYPDPVKTCLKANHTIHIPENTLLVNRDGKKFFVKDSASPIIDKSGNVFGTVLVFTDISETYELTKELAHQATHDPLTGLTNRHEFEVRLERVLNSAKEHNSGGILCYIDMDQFKVVNDSAGHHAGDELLRVLVASFRGHVRQRDTLARLGGDEFGLLMEHCSLEQGISVANKLRGAAQEIHFSWQGKKFSTGVSIGLVAITKGYQSVSKLLHAADQACYAAKHAGRNRVCVFGDNDSNSDKHDGEIQWISRINDCLEEDRFVLAFQQVVAVGQNEQGDHYEILLRIKDENNRLILPGVFMPAAERFGLSTRIDLWVIDKTFEMLNHYYDPSEQLYLCHINLSGYSLSDPEFIKSIVLKLNLAKFPPEKICFELTETAAITDLTRATEFINILKDKGVKFALDDFGSGFCSYGYLKALPVDFVKIDGTFVKGIAENPIALAVIKSMSDLAHLLGKQTIAEFVEDRPTFEKLKEIGVDYAQGFTFGRPLPVMTR